MKNSERAEHNGSWPLDVGDLEHGVVTLDNLVSIILHDVLVLRNTEACQQLIVDQIALAQQDWRRR